MTKFLGYLWSQSADKNKRIKEIVTKKIAIYNDEGGGEFSLYSTLRYFEAHDPILLSAKDIIEGKLTDKIDIFVIPGGADRPYHNKLSGTGNDFIKNYVNNGGVYLGICAGAYYGCANFEFQKDQPYEICETRELAFFNGTAIGCIPNIGKQLYDKTLNSAAVTSIEINNEVFNSFYWGGCYFNGALSPSEIMATYETLDKKYAAIISKNIGKGNAILSGVHFETDSTALINFNFNNNVEQEKATKLSNHLQSPLLGNIIKECLGI